MLRWAARPPPAVFGADGGFVPLLAAATHPSRLAALVLFTAQAAGTKSEEQPWLESADEWDGAIRMFDRCRRSYSPGPAFRRTTILS